MKILEQCPRVVFVVMDGCYFGRGNGVVVFRDPEEPQTLLHYFTPSETVALYQQGIYELQQRGFTIKGIIADGKRGVLTGFKDIPVQMCHFHQLQIITRYLTRNPKLQANIELREIAYKLVRTDEVSMSYWLDKWYFKWKDFLKERTYRDDGSYTYTHRRTRSAYYSLRHNLPYLYTYLKYKNMPNTTNSLEGKFSRIKTQLRVHSGLRWDRKKRVITTLLLD